MRTIEQLESENADLRKKFSMLQFRIGDLADYECRHGVALSCECADFRAEFVRTRKNKT